MRCAVDNFSDRLKLARKRRGITQKEIAEKIGVSTSSYKHYENAENLPSLLTLKALADALDVSTDYLLGRLDEPSTATQTDATTQD